MAKTSPTDGATVSYETSIDAKWKTGTDAVIYTLETSPTSSIELGDLEGGEQTPEDRASRHRPTGFKVSVLVDSILMRKWFLIVFSILVGLLLFALDNTIVTDVQPTIIEDFQAVDQIAWVATGYFLATAALTLSSGQFFQVFNAKWVYVISIFIFEVGSAICGAAPNMNILIIGRVITGLSLIHI